MKKIIIMLLALILLSACTTNPGNSASTELSSASLKTLSSSVASSIDHTSNDKAYSFSEIDSLYGPGPFSVNDLVKVFGEPEYIDGYRFEGGAFAIYIRFNYVIFELVANNGEKLNFIEKDNLQPSSSYREYTVTESDKSVRMKPLNSSIYGGKWPLPRNIKIGDSREKLTKAYNGDKGVEDILEGQLVVSYDYGQSGNIEYYFSVYDTGIDSVSIMWYDTRILRPSDGLDSGADNSAISSELPNPQT